MVLVISIFANIFKTINLYDEFTAFKGLDEENIKNYFLVAQYIKCKKKFEEYLMKKITLLLENTFIISRNGKSDFSY